MKKIVVVFTFLLTISFQINAQWESHTALDSNKNFLPLQTGNKWQYLNVSQPEFSIVSYSLSYASVESDTLINNFFYYRLSDFSGLLRYSLIENKMYVYWNDSDRVYIDFTIPNGVQYQSFLNGQYRTVSSDVGLVDIFNLSRT